MDGQHASNHASQETYSLPRLGGRWAVSGDAIGARYPVALPEEVPLERLPKLAALPTVADLDAGRAPADPAALAEHATKCSRASLVAYGGAPARQPTPHPQPSRAAFTGKRHVPDSAVHAAGRLLAGEPLPAGVAPVKGRDLWAVAQVGRPKSGDRAGPALALMAQRLAQPSKKRPVGKMGGKMSRATADLPQRRAMAALEAVKATVAQEATGAASWLTTGATGSRTVERRQALPQHASREAGALLAGEVVASRTAQRDPVASGPRAAQLDAPVLARAAGGVRSGDLEDPWALVLGPQALVSAEASRRARAARATAWRCMKARAHTGRVQPTGVLQDPAASAAMRAACGL